MTSIARFLVIFFSTLGLVLPAFARPAPPPRLDVDSDGWPRCGAHIAGPCDCDDADPVINPTANDVLWDEDGDWDEVDQNCDDLLNDDGCWELAVEYAREDVPGRSVQAKRDRAELKVQYFDLCLLGELDRDADGQGLEDDCDDQDPRRFRGNPEICDGYNNDCDDGIDEGVMLEWWKDQDGDGHTTSDLVDNYGVIPLLACGPTGFYTATEFTGGDCDDADPTRFPGAVEVREANPAWQIDQDCDGFVETFTTVCLDWDGDGVTSGEQVEIPTTGATGVEGVSGQCDRVEDCDDDNSSVYPGAIENPWLECDNVDQDCDGQPNTQNGSTIGVTQFGECEFLP